MSKDKTISDEQLNACIDGQLDHSDQERLLEMLRDNPEMAHRNCQLQKAHELVRLTYHSEQPPENGSAGYTPPRHWMMGLVASLLIGMGVLIGMIGGGYFKQNSSLLELANTIHTPSSEQGPLAGDKQHWQVMLHVNSNDPYRFSVLLDETEQLLEDSRKNQQEIEIEILTNGPGLELVRDSDTPHARRLRALQDRYSNLVVSACSQALKRLRQKGTDIKLLPKTRVVPSALDNILRRQREGWTYIRI